MGESESFRVAALNGREASNKGGYVLYWMTAARRTSYNYGLQRAAAWARKLARPLLVMEALRVDYPWASPRLHAFVLQGMRSNLEDLAQGPARYYPYVETAPGEGRGLLAALAERACVVVCDRFPCFFIPRMIRAAAEKVRVRLEAVDSCGLLPLDLPGHEFSRAYDFRRYLQQNLPSELARLPLSKPLADLPVRPMAVVSAEIMERWPPAQKTALKVAPAFLSALPLDKEVAPVALAGGSKSARRILRAFLDNGLDRYESQARHPEAQAVSGLSPFLHFGHISAQEVFLAVADREGWGPPGIPEQARGGREGWLGMSPSAEAFLDQLITWRELSYNFCYYRPDYDRYSSLPSWARATLEERIRDERPHLYTLEEFEQARTHDPLWNAAQRQLVQKGHIHNYLRMIWGKKILEWTPGPRQALEVMIQLNNRYALDGRDPNSYSGIFWVLGRFDRAWGPQRPVFGKVRYMSLANTRRKLRLGDYVERYGP